MLYRLGSRPVCLGLVSTNTVFTSLTAVQPLTNDGATYHEDIDRASVAEAQHRTLNPTKRGESALAARIILPRDNNSAFASVAVSVHFLCQIQFISTFLSGHQLNLGVSRTAKGSDKPGALSTTNTSLVEIQGTISGVFFLSLREWIAFPLPQALLA